MQPQRSQAKASTTSPVQFIYGLPLTVYTVLTTVHVQFMYSLQYFSYIVEYINIIKVVKIVLKRKGFLKRGLNYFRTFTDHN